MTLRTAATVLSTVCAAPELAGLVLTEVNPAHDHSGTYLSRYLATVVRALSGT